MKKLYVLFAVFGLVISFCDLIASSYLDWNKAKQIVEAVKLPYNLTKLYKNDLLIKAAEQKRLKEARLLLSEVGVNAVDSEGRTILINVSWAGFKEVVELLLKAGADVNAVDNNGKTALMYAFFSRSKEVVQLLLQAKANVNAVDNNGETALMHGARAGSKEVVQLLKAGADVNAVDNNGKTALMYGAISRSKEVVKLLLQARANVNAVDNNGWTALMLVAVISPRSEEVVKQLLQAGANVNVVNNKGETALMLAFFSRSKEILELLLQAGADVNAVDNNGGTVLMYGARAGLKEVVKLLLQAGADVNAVDRAGKTAIDFVSSYGIYKMLLRCKFFKFVKIDRQFDRMPEPEDYMSEDNNQELSKQEIIDSLTDEVPGRDEERVAAHMADLEAYWHYKVQEAYNQFVYDLNSQPLRALLSEERILPFVWIIMSFFNSQEDFLYVLNELKVGATGQELKRLSLVVEELNRINQSTNNLLRKFDSSLEKV